MFPVAYQQEVEREPLLWDPIKVDQHMPYDRTAVHNSPVAHSADKGGNNPAHSASSHRERGERAQSAKGVDKYLGLEERSATQLVHNSTACEDTLKQADLVHQAMSIRKTNPGESPQYSDLPSGNAKRAVSAKHKVSSLGLAAAISKVIPTEHGSPVHMEDDMHDQIADEP